MPDKISPLNINSTYVVLDENGSSVPIAVSNHFFDDLEQKFGDFKNKHLVSCFTFDRDWDSWEMHPAGDEFVCLLSGRVDLVLEQDGGETVVQLKESGDYVLVPRGTWHTARVHEPSSVLFMTPGEGTQHRQTHILHQGQAHRACP